MLINGATGQVEIAARTCGKWQCPWCAQKKIRRLAWLTENAKPNRLLTLTVDPAVDPDPYVAWLNTHRKVPELMRTLRTKSTEVEYLKVTEVTKRGYPHYHCLLRSGFLAQKFIRERWAQLTAAKIVDIRKVHDTFSTYKYLVKYLTKLHDLEWTDRHVAYSRNFFNPADLEKMRFPDADRVADIEQHPWQVMASRYPDETITQVNPERWIVSRWEDNELAGVFPDELGLGPPAATEHPIRTTTKHLFDNSPQYA
jgi:hypothetical protein